MIKKGGNFVGEDKIMSYFLNLGEIEDRKHENSNLVGSGGHKFA